MMSLEERIRMILRRKGMNLTSLAEAIGQTRQRVHQAFNHGAYSTDWLEKVADAMGCDLEIAFIDKETGERF